MGAYSDELGSNANIEAQLTRRIRQLKQDVKTAYTKGYTTALSDYAWWKDGIQYVGSCGMTLAAALKEGGNNGRI